MNTAATITDNRSTSQDALSWREEQLKGAGYPADDALQLAQRTDIDLHLATDLLRNGCATDTALGILL